MPPDAGRAGCVVLLLLLGSSTAHAQRGLERQCTVASATQSVPALPEGSGLALSRSAPRRLFSINDSGRPEVVVLGLDGSLRGKIAIRGARVTDWEDVTIGACPEGSCLYVADIGDNAAARSRVTIYRMPEPKDGEPQSQAARFDAVYPDRPHDAEAMFAGPGGRLYLLTKEARGAALYAFPSKLSADMPNRLDRIATLSLGSGRRAFAKVTDAEASEDGRTIAVRTNDALFLVPTGDLLAGRLSNAAVFSLRHLREPQGEGVALGPGGEVFVAGEGHFGAGTFTRLTCGALDLGDR